MTTNDLKDQDPATRSLYCIPKLATSEGPPMESSIANFFKREDACVHLPTIAITLNGMRVSSFNAFPLLPLAFRACHNQYHKNSDTSKYKLFASMLFTSSWAIGCGHVI